MRSIRFLSSGAIAIALIFGSYQPVSAQTAEPVLSFTKLWTYGHTATGQVSESAAFDSTTNTIWVAGIVGVDVLDADDGTLVEHIDVTSHGFVNSVAIHNGLAALAVEAPSLSDACSICDRRSPGKVLFYDTATRSPSAGVNEVEVGSLPDMLTFTHNGRKLLVANEATPNRKADAPYLTPDPTGSVTIQLQSSDITTARVPGSVSINAGQLSAQFTVQTTPPVSDRNVSITATYRGASQSKPLTVTSGLQSAISKLEIAPATVKGGATATGTVTLARSAGATGIRVSLSSDNPLAAGLDPFVSVPAGQTSATFPIRTSPVASPRIVTITAATADTSKSATLTVN